MDKSKNLGRIWHFLVFFLVVELLLYDNARYHDAAKDSFTIENYFGDPEKYGGIKIENFGRIVNISEDHFYFDIGSAKLKVFGSGIRIPILGEMVIYLDYRKDGIIEMIDFHTYDYNFILYGISFAALIVFVFIFLKEWKFSWKGFKDA